MEGESCPLKVLMVEDSAADAEMILRALRELPQPLEHARVASADTLRVALAQFDPDVVLSDFSMPGFSGQEALEIVTRHAPDLPLLFVSGATGEEPAIDALQRGAIDYLLKDNLRRLPSAVERALQIARERGEHQRIQQALLDSEERFRSIVESSQDWIWEGDLQGRQTYCNAAAITLSGYTPEEMTGKDVLQFLHPEDRAKVQGHLPEVMARKQGWYKTRLRWLHRDGSVRIFHCTATPMLDEAGELTGYRGINHDITELEQQQLRISQLARLHAVLSALGSAVLRAGSRQAVLDEACRVAVEEGGFRVAYIGQLAEDRSLRLLSSHGDPDMGAALVRIGQLAAEFNDPAQMTPCVRALRSESLVVIPDMSVHDAMPDWVRAQLQEFGTGAQAMLPIGKPAWAVLGLYADQAQVFNVDEVALFERLAAEIDYAVEFIAKSERLAFLAYHNPVSGLFNRAGFYRRLQPLLQGRPLTMALIDLKRFGAINDSRGRAFGDLLLQQAGQRLRALGGADALVAHMESKTFALAYRTSGTAESEIRRLDSVAQAFEREPFAIEGEEIHVDLCGGLAFAPEHGDDPEILEHAAQTALDECHMRGLRIHAFDDELRGRAGRRMALEADLRSAIERDEFELFYQPKFDAASERVVAAEALLRWNRPGAGLVSPAEFIPVLEETGLIVPVGQWVRRTALETAAGWRALGHGAFRICVNVSARELRHPGFLADTRSLLEPHAGNQLIEIELTESLLMEDIEHSIRSLESLRELGCEIAIDDFGTGYSSLNYLTRLPVDVLKIDQSFIALMTESPETMALIANIIQMAHSLSLSVVAEGVETEEQAKLLRLLRCDLLQGYLLGRPVPAVEFAKQFLGPIPEAS
ncbi:MAG: EAL domain-containing protein [Pseudomonadota bacterium]|nr:EAL domain-containing protein [Pseudomonadota bacterium]